MFKWGEYMVPGRKNVVRLATAAVLAMVVALPVWSATPTGSQDLAGFKKTDIGGPDTPGSVTVEADGTWTVKGSGNAFNGNTEDQLYFISKSVKGNGSMIVKEFEAAPEGNQYVGPMIRASLDANAAMAGAIASTTYVNFIHRTAADETAVRDDGNAAKFTLKHDPVTPQWMMIQRVGNSVQAFESSDGRLWEVVKPALNLPLNETAEFGLAVSSRASDVITAHVGDVQVLEGVTSVQGIEGAATDKVALITWLPMTSANLLGYNIYRGVKDATLDKMTLLNSSGPLTDPSYLDNAAAGTSLRDMSYVVAPVFKGADGTPFEGPAVRAR